MLQHAMPGESLQSNGISGDKLTSPSDDARPTYQELQGKLQEAKEKAAKFESYRNRFRAVIDSLMKDNEQLTKDKEALQKECEKERQRTEAERKRAEEEKALREKIEKAGLSTKEQLVLIQKRVEGVARTSKSDRDHVERLQKEVKQVVSRLSQAIQAVEGAHVSYRSLEEKLRGKVSNVELASSKSSSLAQKAISDEISTQGKATTAENLSRTLVSQIADLDQRLKGLTHEFCIRLLDHPEDGLKSKVVRFPSGLGAAEDAESFPKKRVVLPKSQQPTGAFVNAPNPAGKDSRVEGSVVSPRALLAKVKSLPSTDVPLRADFSAELSSHSPNVGHVSVSQVPPSGALHEGQVVEKAPIVCSSPVNDTATHGCVTNDPNLQEEGKVPVTSSNNTVREALEAAKKKKDVLKGSSTSKVALPPNWISTFQRSSPGSLQKNSADEIREFAARTRVHPTDIAKFSYPSNDALQPRLVSNVQSSHAESLQKNPANEVGECLVPTKIDSADILKVSSTSILPPSLVSSGPSSCSETPQKNPADEIEKCVPAKVDGADILKVSPTSILPPSLVSSGPSSCSETPQKNPADEIEECVPTKVDGADILKVSSTSILPPSLVSSGPSSCSETPQKNPADEIEECVPTKVDGADVLRVSLISRNALPPTLVSNGPSSCPESLQKNPVDERGECVVRTKVDCAEVLRVSLTSRNALSPMLVSNGPSSCPESLQKNPADEIGGGVVQTEVDSADILKALSTSRHALSPRLVSNDPSSPPESLQENPVDEIEEFVVQTEVDCPNGSKPAFVEAEKSVSEKEILKCLASNQGNKVCSLLGRSSSKSPLGISDDNGARTSTKIPNPLLRASSRNERGAEMLQSGITTAALCPKRDKFPVSLLRDVTKLFEKERKVHAKMEGKFAALAWALQNGLEDPAEEDAEKMVGKRKRRKSMKDVCRKKICTQSEDERVIVSSSMIAPCTRRPCRDTEDGPFEGGAVDPCKLVIRGSNTGKESIPAAVQNHLSQLGGICEESQELGSKLLDGMQDQELEGSGKEGKVLACHQNLLIFEMEAEEVMSKVQLMFKDSKDLSYCNLAGEWHSESDSSDSSDNWWVRQHVLLSPIRRKVPPPSLHETMESNSLSTWPPGKDMSLDDFSLHIDTLPSVDQVHVVTDQTMTDAENLKLGSEENCSLSTTISEREDSKENGAEGVSVHNGPVCLPLLSPCSVLFPQEADAGAKAGKSRNCASSCAAGEQYSELNSMQWLAEKTCEHLYGPHSLELMWCPSACEPDMVVSHAAKEASNLSMSVISANVNRTMGSVRKLFCQALTHVESGEAGSNPQPAEQMVSILSDSKFSKAVVLCIFTASLVDSFALWNSENQATSLIAEQKSLQHLADIVQQVFLSQVFHGVLLPTQVHSVFANCLLHFIICGEIRPFCQSWCEQSMEVINVSEQYFYFTTNSSNVNNHHALISGSKLLASYCEKTGKKDFLSNSVYLILRFCEKESFWLLASLSSFASVYCKSLFTVDSTDLVGQAIHVVIAELLRDAEMCTQMRKSSQTLLGSTVDTESQLEVEQNSINQVKESSNNTHLFRSFGVLEEIVGDKAELQFDGLLPKLLSALNTVISPTVDLVLPDNRHLFQNRMCVKPFNQMKWKTAVSPALDNSDPAKRVSSKSIPSHTTCNGRDGSVYERGESDEGGTMFDEFRCQFATQSSILTSELQPVIQLKQMTNIMDDWEQKFSNLINAVELIAFHLGWNWTYNEFIVEHLWKLVTPGAPAMTLVCVAHLFSTLGCFGRDLDGSDLPGVEGLRTSLSVVLNSDPQRSIPTGDEFNLPLWAQVSVAESLLVLSGWNWNMIRSNEGTGNDAMSFSDLHKQSIKCLLNWFQSLKKEVQQTLPPSLRCAFAVTSKEEA